MISTNSLRNKQRGADLVIRTNSLRNKQREADLVLPHSASNSANAIAITINTSSAKRRNHSSLTTPAPLLLCPEEAKKQDSSSSSRGSEYNLEEEKNYIHQCDTTICTDRRQHGGDESILKTPKVVANITSCEDSPPTNIDAKIPSPSSKSESLSATSPSPLVVLKDKERDVVGPTQSQNTRIPHFRTAPEALKIIRHQKDANNILAKVVLRKAAASKLAVEEALLKSTEAQKLEFEYKKMVDLLEAKDSNLMQLWLQYDEEKRKSGDTQLMLQRSLKDKSIVSAGKTEEISRLQEELKSAQNSLKSTESVHQQLLARKDKDTRTLSAESMLNSTTEGNTCELLDQSQDTEIPDLRQLGYSLLEKETKIQEAEMAVKDLAKELRVVENATNLFVEGALGEMKDKQAKLEHIIVKQRAQIEELRKFKEQSVDTIAAFEERCGYLEKKIDRQSRAEMSPAQTVRKRPLSQWKLFRSRDNGSSRSLSSYSLDAKYGEDPLNRSIHSTSSAYAF